MKTHPVFQSVKPDMLLLNQEIMSQFASSVPLVEKIADYIIQSGGKRLRPLIVMLVAQGCGYKGNMHIKLATVIEFLHTATLLHDDVVDTSDQRRGKPTANAQWGNAPSVLVGDFVYSRAFELLVVIGRLPIMGCLAHATSLIAEGEVRQLVNIKNPDVTEIDYMKVIQGKTATLFEAAAFSAACLADSDSATCDAMTLYGRHLGLAFQIVDDVLDFTGDAKTMGKNVGDDLAEGKATLPLIRAMESGTAEQRTRIRDAIIKGSLDDLAAIQTAIEETGALIYCMEKAREQAELAKQQLDCLPDSIFKSHLKELANVAVNRLQ